MTHRGVLFPRHAKGTAKDSQDRTRHCGATSPVLGDACRCRVPADAGDTHVLERAEQSRLQPSRSTCRSQRQAWTQSARLAIAAGPCIAVMQCSICLYIGTNLRTQAVARERRRSASERLRAWPPVACDASHAAACALRRRRINMGRQLEAGLRPCSNLHRHGCAERMQRRACLDASIRRCRASIAGTD